METHALFSEIKTITDKTIFILAKHPETQDDDKLLYTYFIIYGVGKGNFEQGKSYLSKVLAIDFVRDVSKHIFVDFGSVSRCRRLIQAKKPHLQGTVYHKRQKANTLFRKNINVKEKKSVI